MNSNYSNYLTKYLSDLNSDKSKKNKIDWLSYNYDKLLPTQKDAHILEIGPGLGELIEYLTNFKNYKNVKAIDISDEVVDYCNQHSPGSTIKVEDTTSFLKKSKRKYKLILLFQLLEHIPKDEVHDFLTSIKEALTDDGIAIIEVPNIANNIVGLSSFFSDFTHEVAYTSTSLSFVLSNAGFSSVEIHNLKVPRVSIGRHVQSLLQSLIESALSILHRIYLPSQKTYLAPTIYAVAKK